MDPDENLREQLALASKMSDELTVSPYIALDLWLRKGGYQPSRWERRSEPHTVSPPSRMMWCKNCNRPKWLHTYLGDYCPGRKTNFLPQI